MPGKSSQSDEILGKLRGRLSKAHETAKEKPVEVGNIQLPAGIEGGIAQLSEIRWGVYEDGDNKGKPYVLLIGIVQTPEMVDKIKTKGQPTRIGPIPLCDTPNATGRKTLEEHYARLLNELKKLDEDTFSSIDYEELGPACEALVEAAPYFLFRTWKGRKQEAVQRGKDWYVGQNKFPSLEAAKARFKYLGTEPLTNHEWCGVTEYTPDESPESIADDDTRSAKTQTNGQKPPGKNGPVASTKPGKKGPTADEEAPASDVDLGDLDTLVSRSEDGEEEAQDELTALALAKGVTQEQVDGADGWQEVADLVMQAQSDSGDEPTEATDDATDQEPEPDEAPAFSKGDIVLYAPDPKKPGKKAKCEIVSVNEKASTARLKVVATGKTVTTADGKTPVSVHFDALEIPE